MTCLFSSPLNLCTGGTALARVARSEVFDPREVSVFHCINRSAGSCVPATLVGRHHLDRTVHIVQAKEFLLRVEIVPRLAVDRRALDR
jgi:hypothetical protein